MATELTKPMKRELNIEGVGVVEATMSSEGIALRPKGRRVKLTITWDQLIEAGALPENAPARHSESVATKKAWLSTD